ncbi:unnamed protein product [Rotaria sordida]|uniref:RING-type domain-containing protein n=1 Tax=Rotaria sordida TaxID=392033 RepID=A0A815F588_9BILA|nr:unnamed protein product [Rotaria sordida]CAF1321327.1 unnamed protein product [Rotaria sordida]
MSQQISLCEQCHQQYTLFRRKKQCNLCGQIFCSKCIQKPGPSIGVNCSRACTTCLLIINEHTTNDQLASIRTKHLRAYLIYSNKVSLNHLESCFEKQDLINLIQSKKDQIYEQNYVFVERRTITNTQTSNHNTTTENINHDQQSTVNTDEQTLSSNINSSLPTNESETETSIERSSLNVSSSISTNESESKGPIEYSPPNINSNRIALNDILSLESINNLTIRQLKDILIQNFVSTNGCVEKKDLINKVELLYRDHQKQKESNINITNEQSDENLCKICMDANIDCVFLNCGHLCTCIRCGKQLSECPLCRSYIIRVVRVFKS